MDKCQTTSWSYDPPHGGSGALKARWRTMRVQAAIAVATPHDHRPGNGCGELIRQCRRRRGTATKISTTRRGQSQSCCCSPKADHNAKHQSSSARPVTAPMAISSGQLPRVPTCLLYTSDAADEEDSVDLGGRRIIKK